MRMNKGDPVEVCSDEEGFGGAWFAATIVKKLGEGFLVEFRDLMTTDEKSMLRERVDASQIRPVPPLLNADHFVPHQEVDAYDLDGWWGGVVSEVLEDNMYRVYFRQTREEKAYPASQLRVHQDWIDDKWVHAPEHPKTLPFYNEKGNDTSSKPVRRSTRINKKTRETRVCGGQCEKDSDCEGLPMAGSQLIPKSTKRKQVTEGQLNNDDTPTSTKNKERPKMIELENSQSAIPSGSPVPDGETITITIPYLEDIEQGIFYQANRHSLQGKPSLRQLEILAYHYVLQALYVQGAHSWGHEVVLTNLREVLHISNEEHSNELKRLISSQYN